MLALTTPRIASTQRYSSPKCWASQDENRKYASLLGFRFAHCFRGLSDCLCHLRLQLATRSAGGQRNWLAVWRHRLQLHGFCRATRREKARAHLATGPRTNLDAWAPVARLAGAADDSLSWRFSFWRHAHACAHVVAHRHGGQRRFWRGSAALHSP